MVMVCRGEKEQANGLPADPRGRGATYRGGGAGCCANLWTDDYSLVIARMSPPALLCPWVTEHKIHPQQFYGNAAITLLPPVEKLVCGMVFTGEVIGLIKNAFSRVPWPE